MKMAPTTTKLSWETRDGDETCNYYTIMERETERQRDRDKDKEIGAPQQLYPYIHQSTYQHVSLF